MKPPQQRFSNADAISIKVILCTTSNNHSTWNKWTDFDTFIIYIHVYVLFKYVSISALIYSIQFIAYYTFSQWNYISISHDVTTMYFCHHWPFSNHSYLRIHSSTIAGQMLWRMSSCAMNYGFMMCKLYDFRVAMTWAMIMTWVISAV